MFVPDHRSFPGCRDRRPGRPASRERTEEGDVWTFDDMGRPTGMIVMEPRERLERDGAVYVTLPSGERERLQGVEAAMRGPARSQ